MIGQNLARFRTRLNTVGFVKNARQCLLFAALIILPLIYANYDLVKNGHHPVQAGANIEFGQTLGTLEVEDEEY